MAKQGKNTDSAGLPQSKVAPLRLLFRGFSLRCSKRISHQRRGIIPQRTISGRNLFRNAHITWFTVRKSYPADTDRRWASLWRSSVPWFTSRSCRIHVQIIASRRTPSSRCTEPRWFAQSPQTNL